MFWKKKKSAPDYWEAYLAAFSERVVDHQPIAEIPFWVMDTETTGLDPKKDELLSIAGIPLQGYTMRLAQSFECLLKQKRPPGRESIPIHGILPTPKVSTQLLESVLPDLLAKIDNRIIVGHHIRFDVQMLNKSIKSITGGQLQNKVLDTADLARRLPAFRKKGMEQPISLDHLCAYFALKKHGRHTAVGDTFLTARILCALLKALEKQGLKTRGDLLRKPLKIHRY